MEDINIYGRPNTLKPYRCQVCNYVYLGFKSPDHCPHCGAEQSVMVRYYKYVDIPKNARNIQADGVRDRNMEEMIRKAVQLESHSEAVYRNIADNTDDVMIESYFRRFARHEETHKDKAAELLGITVTGLPEIRMEDYDINTIFSKLVELENETIEHYQNIINNSNIFQVRYFFKHLMEVEINHRHTGNNILEQL